ncbi:hypothetical protein AAC387_Pa08g1812 [Persea americana]
MQCIDLRASKDMLPSHDPFPSVRLDSRGEGSDGNSVEIARSRLGGGLIPRHQNLLPHLLQGRLIIAAVASGLFLITLGFESHVGVEG